jgi:hypothetical protein
VDLARRILKKQFPGNRHNGLAPGKGRERVLHQPDQIKPLKALLDLLNV